MASIEKKEKNWFGKAMDAIKVPAGKAWSTITGDSDQRAFERDEKKKENSGVGVRG